MSIERKRSLVSLVAATLYLERSWQGKALGCHHEKWQKRTKASNRLGITEMANRAYLDKFRNIVAPNEKLQRKSTSSKNYQIEKSLTSFSLSMPSVRDRPLHEVAKRWTKPKGMAPKEEMVDSMVDVGDGSRLRVECRVAEKAGRPCRSSCGRGRESQDAEGARQAVVGGTPSFRPRLSSDL